MHNTHTQTHSKPEMKSQQKTRDSHRALRLLTAVLFWGALWGLAEATLGWGLHRLHVPAVSLIMFPAGLFCQWMATKRSGSVRAAFGVAAVAAAVKLTDLLVPGPWPAWHVVNPAMHILLEGVATALVFSAASRAGNRSFAGVAAKGCLVFVVALALQKLFQWGMSATVGFNPAVSAFWSDGLWAAALLGCAVEATAAVALFRMAAPRERVALRPALALGAVAAAVAVNLTTFIF